MKEILEWIYGFSYHEKVKIKQDQKKKEKQNQPKRTMQSKRNPSRQWLAQGSQRFIKILTNVNLCLSSLGAINANCLLL